MIQVPTSQTGRQPAQVPVVAPTAASQFVEPLVLPFTILKDTRERQAGWTFQNIIGSAADKYRPLIVPQVERHMVTADYTIEGVPVYVERKSRDDFIGTLGGGHDNFRKEHQRMEAIIAGGGKCFVIVEANYADIIEELESPHSARKLHPNSVEGIVASWPAKYGVTWHFAGSRRQAERLALSIMRTWYKKLTGEQSNGKASCLHRNRAKA